MRTRPAAFSAVQMSVAAEQHIIVKLYDGTSTWLFSDIDMHLSDGHVYPLFIPEDFNGPIEAVDIMSKEWVVGEAVVGLSNIRYRKDTSSDWVKFSEEAGGLLNGTMTIYLASGRNVAALSDCLTRWAGTIVEAPEYDLDRIIVRAVDNTIVYNVLLPQRYMNEIDYGEHLIDENSEKKLPIVYGEFARKASGNDDIFSGIGLAKTYRISTYPYSTRHALSGHDIYSFTELYYDLGGPSILAVGNLTDTGYDSGDDIYTVWVNGQTYCYDLFIPNESPPSDYDDSGYTPDNSSYAHDGNSSTQAGIKDNVTDNGTEQIGRGNWGITNSDIMMAHLQRTSGELIDNETYPIIYFQQKNATWESTDAIAGNDVIIIQFYFSRDGSSDRFINVATMSTSGSEWGQSTWVNYASKNITNFAYPLDTELMLSIYAQNTASDDANSSTDDDVIIKFGEIQFCLQVYYITAPLEGWAELSGRMFGSWIDGGSRSNSYDEYDLIEDPAFIIESLLRDELSLSDSDINLSSFDDAANSSVKARINLHSENEMRLNDVIRQLAEQSTFAFYWSAAGKARLIALNDSTPTTAVRGSHSVIIPYSHIVEGTIKISKDPHIINHLNVESRWQEEYQTFRDVDVVENSTSQTSYGVRKYEAKWKNIATTSSDHVAAHLVSNANGIWANAHNVIEFEAAGFTGADIEIGDWIEFDSTTVDPHITLFGTSFSGIQFLVMEMVMGLQSTYIKAIELY